jgi:hypothetical protein
LGNSILEFWQVRSNQKSQNNAGFLGYVKLNVVHVNLVFLGNVGDLVIGTERAKVVFIKSYSDKKPKFVKGVVWTDWGNESNCAEIEALFPKMPEKPKEGKEKWAAPKKSMIANVVIAICGVLRIGRGIVAMGESKYWGKKEEQNRMSDVPMETMEGEG